MKRYVILHSPSSIGEDKDIQIFEKTTIWAKSTVAAETIFKLLYTFEISKCLEETPALSTIPDFVEIL